MDNPKSESKKLIPIYLQQLFLNKTDKNHYIRMPDILKYLEYKNIYADRRTVYSAISLLNTAGFEIQGVQEKGGYKYHHINRTFDTTELKFLVDSVASSRFLTKSKSTELIEKIKSLGSTFDNDILNRNILISQRIKSMNNKVLKNLDTINVAINSNIQIQFQYMKWNWQKKLEFTRDGSFYNVSPFAIMLSDDRYYLISFNAMHNTIYHYRIDKIHNINLLNKPREGLDLFKNFNIAHYSNITFNMFGGKREYVKLRCRKNLANVIFDRFGEDINIRPDFDDTKLAGREQW